MELSLVIPAYNEGASLRASLAEVSAWIARHHPDAEVVVVDDGSTDDTAVILREAAAADARLVPVITGRNRGKGAAVAEGVSRARGAVIVFFDADLAYPLDLVDRLVDRIRDGAAVAVGARDLDPEANRAAYRPLRRLATAAFNALVSTALGLDNGDTQCGLKAFRADAARALFRALTIPGFGFDVELLFLAERWGLRVERVPVRMRASGTSSVRIVRDSVRMAGDLVRIRLRARRGAYPRDARA